MGEYNSLSDSGHINAKHERPRATGAFVSSRLRHSHHFHNRLPGRRCKNEGNERRSGLLPSQADRPAGATPCRLFAGCTQQDKANFCRYIAVQTSLGFARDPTQHEIACRAHARRSRVSMLTSSELFNRIPSQLGDSKADPQSDRGIEVVALEKGEGQSVIHLREHDPKIETPLWCKPPIDSGRDRVERPGALRVLGAKARGGPPGGGAEKRILDIMVIGADHIQIFSNSVLGAGPHDLESLVTKTVHAEGGIVDIRVVERIAAQTKKA